MREIDDFGLDIEFGKWLSQVRTKANLSLKDASKLTAISEERLKSLEIGYAERGIRRTEAEILSKTYGLKLDEFLQRALGDDDGE